MQEISESGTNAERLYGYGAMNKRYKWGREGRVRGSGSGTERGNVKAIRREEKGRRRKREGKEKGNVKARRREEKGRRREEKRKGEGEKRRGEGENRRGGEGRRGGRLRCGEWRVQEEVRRVVLLRGISCQ